MDVSPKRRPDTPVRFGHPHVLPGGDWAVGTLIVTGAVALLSLETGALSAVTLGGTIPLDSVQPTQMLLGSSPHYLSGHLTYLSHGDGILMAVPFDADSRQVTGRPFPVLEDVRREAVFGFGQYTLSDDGTLIYVSGGNQALGHLAIIDRGGTADTLPFPRAQYHGIRLSPDGTRIASFEWSETVGGSEIKVLDIGSGAVERLPLNPRLHYATGAWSPGGDSLLIKRYDPVTSAGMGALLYRFSDNSVVELTREGEFGQTDFLPDGERIIYDRGGQMTLMRLRAGEVERGPFIGGQGRVSPDGAWLAFQRGVGDGLAVTSMPPSSSWTQVVVGREPDSPEWTSSGTSIIYRDIRTFREVDIHITDGSVRAGESRVYAEGPFQRVWHSPYDLTPDDRLLVPLAAPEASTQYLKVITDFDREIARRAQESGN